MKLGAGAMYLEFMVEQPRNSDMAAYLHALLTKSFVFFLLLLMIVLLVPAVQSFPDVTYGSGVDSTPMGTPIGMYVAT